MSKQAAALSRFSFRGSALELIFFHLLALITVSIDRAESAAQSSNGLDCTGKIICLLSTPTLTNTNQAQFTVDPQALANLKNMPIQDFARLMVDEFILKLIDEFNLTEAQIHEIIANPRAFKLKNLPGTQSASAESLVSIIQKLIEARLYEKTSAVLIEDQAQFAKQLREKLEAHLALKRSKIEPAQSKLHEHEAIEQVVRIPTPAAVIGVSPLPDGKRWLAITGDRYLRIFDAQSKIELAAWKPEIPDLGAPVSYAVDPQGQFVIVHMGTSSYAYKVDLNRKMPVTYLHATGSVVAPPFISFWGKESSIITHPDQGMHLSIWHADHVSSNLTLPPLNSPEMKVHVLRGIIILPRGIIPTQALFSPNGKHLLISLMDGSIRLWNGKHRDLSRELPLHIFEPPSRTGPIKSRIIDRRPRALAFSNDSRLAADDLGGEQIRVWQVATREVLREFHGHQGPIRSIKFNSNASLLLSTSKDGTARLWSMKDGKEIWQTDLKGEKDRGSAEFSNDGRKIILGDSSGIRVIPIQSEYLETTESLPPPRSLWDQIKERMRHLW